MEDDDEPPADLIMDQAAAYRAGYRPAPAHDEAPPAHLVMDRAEADRAGYRPTQALEEPPAHLIMDRSEADRQGFRSSLPGSPGKKRDRSSPEQPEPEAEGQFVSGVKAFAKGVIPTTAGVLGAVASAPLGAPAGPVGMIGTALAGGFATSAAAQKAQDWVLDQFRGGPDIQAAINAKEHPWTTAIAGAAPALLTLNPSVAGRQLIPSIAPRLSGLAERGVSAAVSGAVEGAQQLVTGEYHPEALATSIGMGALAPRTRSWVDPVEQAGARFATRVHGTPGSKGAAGTAEEQPKPVEEPVGDPQNKPTRSERDYPAEPTAGQTEEAPSGINVGRVDPTLASVFEIPDSPGQKRGEAEAQRQQPGEPPAVAPAERPPIEATTAPPPEPAPRPAVEPVPGPPAAERASKAIPLSAAEEARSKALADEVLAGKRDPNDPELAALAARKRAVGDEGKPAAAEVPQEKLDTLFDNSPHKGVIPPKQRPAYDEGARDAFADRPSRPTSDLAKRLGGIYDRGYSDASKVLFAEERALREKPGEPAPAKPTVGDQLKAQERARQEARAAAFDKNDFIAATVKGPETTAEYARATGMTDEQVRAEIYSAGDSNRTSEARYQRYLVAKEASPTPTPREAVEQPPPKSAMYYPDPKLTDPGMQKANSIAVEAINGRLDQHEALRNIVGLVESGQVSRGYASVMLDRLPNVLEGDIRKAFGDDVPTRTPRAAIEQRAPGQTVDEALKTSQAMRRQDMVRGRPIKTAPLPIGTEQAILEAGAARAAAGGAGGGAGKPPVPPVPPAGGAAGAGGPTPPTGVPLREATKEDLASGLLASVRRMLMPSWSGSAREAGSAIREAYGPLFRLKEQALARFSNDMHRVLNSLTPENFRQFMKGYEGGDIKSLPEQWRPIADRFKQGYDEFWNEVTKLKGHEQKEAVENYFTHMYENQQPNEIKDFVSKWYGSRGGSLKQRTHPTYEDALQAGLKPISSNPMESFVRYMDGMSHYVAQRRVIQTLEDEGRIWRGRPESVAATGSPEPATRDAPPAGYAKIDVPWAGNNAYAPRDIAETINQFYAAGLRGGQAKNVMQFLQHMKNTWTAAELGLSAYHFTTMSGESVASGLARGLQAAAAGEYKMAAKEFAAAPLEPYTSYRLGARLQRVFRGVEAPANRTEQMAMDALAKANIRPGDLLSTREYDMTRYGNFVEAWQRGSLKQELKAQLKEVADAAGYRMPDKAAAMLLNNVARTMQTISAPLFQYYIPRLKLGTVMKNMEQYIHLNPQATEAELNAFAKKIADSIDNRMGEMVADNLFMNKAVKDAGYMTLRSFAWTVGGPFREILGGAGSGVTGALKGQNRLNPRSASHDPRVAYAMAFAPAIGLISAVYQYMKTREAPESLVDLMAPRTGGEVMAAKKMSPERILVPGYHKDFLGYFVNPMGWSEELKAKLAAPWSAAIDQFTGKDWRGHAIVPPNASLADTAYYRGKAVLEKMLPISGRQFAEGGKKGSALTIPERLVGVRQPGGYLINPEGTYRAAGKRAEDEWIRDQKVMNRQRAERGQPPLPIVRPQGPYKPPWYLEYKFGQ